MTRTSRRSPEIRWDTEGGSARCPSVNSYDRWFSDMLIFRGVRIIHSFSHLDLWCTARDKRSSSEFTVNVEARRQDSGNESDEAGGYNSCPQLHAFVLLPPSTFPHKSEIRIKKVWHIINVRWSRKMRSARRRRHLIYTCRFIKNIHSSYSHTRVHVGASRAATNRATCARAC